MRFSLARRPSRVLGIVIAAVALTAASMLLLGCGAGTPERTELALVPDVSFEIAVTPDGAVRVGKAPAR